MSEPASIRMSRPVRHASARWAADVCIVICAAAAATGVIIAANNLFVTASMVLALCGVAGWLWRTGNALALEHGCNVADALRETERRFSIVIDALDAVFWISNFENGKCLYLSPGFEKHFTTNRAEVMDNAFAHFKELHPEDRARIAASVQKALRAAESFDHEYRVLAANGTIKWMRGRGFPVRESSGAVQYFAGLVEDISDRKASDIAIGDAYAYLRALVHASPIGIITYRSDGTVAAHNASAAHLLGATPIQLCAHNFRQSATWQTTGLLDAANAALETGEQRDIEASFVTIYGRPVSLKCRFTRFGHANGQNLLVMLLDISAAKQNEMALREAEEKFRQLAEYINDVFWTVTADLTRTIYVSPAFKAVWGVECDEMMRNPRLWLDCVIDEDRGNVQASWNAFAQTPRETLALEYRITSRDGSKKWIFTRAWHVNDANGQSYRIVGVSNDISERKRLEERFRQSQKMEAIGMMAGGIAHDLNNIMATITGFTTLAQQMSPDPEVDGCLREVMAASVRATNVVRQLLTIGRPHEQRRSPVDLSRIVSESMKLLRASIPAGIEFDLLLPAGLSAVAGDPHQIQQVVVNLGTNASHAMRSGKGTLSVSVEAVVLDAARAAETHGLKPGRHLRLTVSDTGHGMDAPTLDRIWDPFFTTKAQGEGSGLGLTVVHSIVKNHNGGVHVRSAPGQGTTFEVYFPAANEPTPAESASRAAVPRGNGEAILIVDDEEPVARATALLLQHMGYDAHSTRSATEALENIQRDPKRFSAVITDQTMPRLSGLELAREIRRCQPAMPIVITSGYSSLLSPENLRKAGVGELLPKPATPEAIARAVHRSLTVAKSGDGTDSAPDSGSS